MLTRLKVSGFKNLVDVDVRFGPFTCITGANGVGKSNLFDAIQFLSLLADQPLRSAALAIRGAAEVQNLFHRAGSKRMSFEAEMIVPSEGVDDLGQPAEASITSLIYRLDLGSRLEVLHEELRHINIGDAHRHFPFPHSAAKWRRSAVKGRRGGDAFISTVGKGANRLINLHQDGGYGSAAARIAEKLPRTVLSVTNAAEGPTAFLARLEMRSWRRLDAAAFRQPDELTLNRLAQKKGAFDALAEQLSRIEADVKQISVDRGEKLALRITTHDGAVLPLSDGALRFLVLLVLAEDPEPQPLLCIEAPEAGISPGHIPALLGILQSIPTDTESEIGPQNPLSQVIIETHSPAVVQALHEDTLLFGELRTKQKQSGASFRYLPDTWRARAAEEQGDDPQLVANDVLQLYRNPLHMRAEAPKRRAETREDPQPLLPGFLE